MTSSACTTRHRIAALLLPALLLAACGGGADDASRMAAATQYATNGEYRSAMIELKNLLQKNPDHAQARALLGEVALELGDAASAEKDLRRAGELGIPASELAVPLARAYVGIREYQKVLDQLPPLLSGDHPDHAVLLVLQGDAHLGLKELSLAQSNYEEALRHRPGLEAALLGLASVERLRGDMDAAEARVREAIAANPDAELSRIAMGRLMLVQGRFAESASAFSEALDRIATKGATPSRYDALAGLTESRLGNGDPDGAESAINRLADIAPNHPLTEFLRARIAFERDDFEAARTHLASVLSRVPDYAPARMLHGAVSLALRDYAQAEMYLTSIVADNPANVEARKMLAGARLGLAQPADAVKALLPAVDDSGDDGALLAMLARASLRAGDSAGGIGFFEKSAAADPDNGELQMELAAGYLAANRIEEAIALLERLGTHAAVDQYRRELLLILAQVRAGDHDSARTSAAALLSSHQDDATLHSLLGGIEMSVGNSEAARRHFEDALVIDPVSASAAVNLARLEYRAGNAQAARQRLETFAVENPDDLVAIMALAQVEELSGNPARAAEWMEKARRANPDALQPRLALARYYLNQGNAEEATRAAIEAVGVRPEDPQAHYVLGLAQMGAGAHQQAYDSFGRALAERPGWVEALFHQGRLQLLLGRPVESRETMDRVLALAPDHVGAAAMLSTMELQRGNTAQALTLARTLQAAHPEHPVPLVLIGDVAVARRDFAAAAEAYAQALAKGGDRTVNAKLYQSRLAQEDPDALDTLNHWLEKQPDDVPTRLLLAQARQSSGAMAAAEAEYRAVLDRQPNNAIALNNLAWLYADSDLTRAISMAEKAYEAVPASGAIADTLGWLLLQAGEVQRGAGLLRRAHELSPESPDIGYHLAAALARTGREAEARRLLDRVLSDSNDFSARTAARQLRDEL